jgi:hypothetical protein
MRTRGRQVHDDQAIGTFPRRVGDVRHAPLAAAPVEADIVEVSRLQDHLPRETDRLEDLDRLYAHHSTAPFCKGRIKDEMTLRQM